MGGFGDVTFTFTFMHLADAFIQSDLQCIQAIHFFFFYQYVCSLGIEPTTFCAANAMLLGSKARVFGGMGRGMAEDGVKEGRGRGGEKVAAGAAIGGMLALGKAP